MTQQYLSVEEFNQLLQQWNGKTIKISKRELEDHDNMVMELNSISYSKDTRRIDDYESIHTLKLNGPGKIQTDADGYQPLPSDFYEIPLEDTTIYQYDQSQFSLLTDRGTYTIEIALDV
ncbi:hypothetical protein NC797_06235 [Aquibacillus sp. 3ASR75-11]|uniref:Uncharacterized protein n=1 Tax=Terrihalobacillus insolitus TaxID=2950438 RepID=A0A9X4AN27_9BACI|nr:hypothetical protein [Terrihalobacillus insolitus]MDC3414015.1 hypothetical protein [Terrihalobacillus insolitus]MDC3424105.1 hypothetical protein [Terrihalobacillus insolitus]